MRRRRRQGDGSHTTDLTWEERSDWGVWKGSLAMRCGRLFKTIDFFVLCNCSSWAWACVWVGGSDVGNYEQ
jgi:hypothetical protein